MTKLFCIVSVVLTAVALPAVGQQLTTPSPSTQSPARIILDTDMDSDCDDAGALALLHVLADHGEAKILAVAASSLYRWSVPCIEAINRYYGRPDLPIGPRSVTLSTAMPARNTPAPSPNLSRRGGKPTPTLRTQPKCTGKRSLRSPTTA